MELNKLSSPSIDSVPRAFISVCGNIQMDQKKLFCLFLRQDQIGSSIKLKYLVVEKALQ